MSGEFDDEMEKRKLSKMCSLNYFQIERKEHTVFSLVEVPLGFPDLPIRHFRSSWKVSMHSFEYLEAYLPVVLSLYNYQMEF